MPAYLRLEPLNRVGGWVEAAATFEGRLGRLRLWWRLPQEWEHALSGWADPFVVGFLFPMMQAREAVRVEGRVSPSLLENLQGFMSVWSAWLPLRYGEVVIRGAEEIEQPPAPLDGRGEAPWILPFSGGVDSCFTLMRHVRGQAGAANRHIGAGVVINGFDIAPGHPDPRGAYESVLGGAGAQLASMNVPCIPLAGNFRSLPTHWLDSFGTQLASGMLLLAGKFHGALIANSLPWISIHLPWGSNPITDPFLGSRHFPVRDDGAHFRRIDKIETLGHWPEGLRHLRVCYQAGAGELNCCRCEKCVRNILTYRIVGIPRPAAFHRDVPDDYVTAMRLTEGRVVAIWGRLLRLVEERGMGGESWAGAMAVAVRRGRRLQRLAAIKESFLPARQFIRRMVRGSPMSRRERALSPPSQERIQK